MTRLAALLAVSAASVTASAQPLVFVDGAVERPIALDTLPRAELEVRDPTDGDRTKKFSGVRLAALLEARPAPRGADALAVRCNDGWLSLVPLATVKRFPEALLALSEHDHPLAAPRGPLFLAWPNLTHREVDADHELTPNGWAWGVASLEYVRLADFAAPLRLPPRSPPEAVRGASLFTHHCQRCHALNGAGGRAGWDLNQPNVLSYRTEAYVRDYILDPRTRNPYGHMSPFRGKLASADVAALIAYLRAMAN